MPAVRARFRPIAACLLAAAIVALGCDVNPPSTAPSSGVASARPSASSAVDASVVPYTPVTYPLEAEAPCGEATAPDATHGPYTGNLRRISAPDASTVVFDLCEPDVAFLSRISSPSFAIQDSGWLQATIDPASDGEPAIVRDVNGTGPFMLQAWNRGSDITLARNDAYRGGPAIPERLIFRWTKSSRQRLAELQERTVDGIDDLDARDAEVAAQRADLDRLDLPGLNLMYLGFNDRFAPFDSAQVRQAIALGLDRKALVDAFYPMGSTAASHAAPCELEHGCTGSAIPEYDPTRAKEILATAGFPDGFKTTIRYSDVARDYMPDPTGIATAIQTQLKDNLGIKADLEVVEFDQFVGDIDAGKLDGMHLLGTRSRYPDVSGFLDPLFGKGASDEFGTKDEALTAALAKGAATTDVAKRAKAYATANDTIAKRLPMIPIAHAGSSVAYQADITGATASPLGIDHFADMSAPGRRQFVWMQESEPSGLYCADQTTVDALRVCAQIGELLYTSGPTGATVVPSLADACEPDADLVTWTCTLPSGVRFHDGADLDAGDVVDTFAVQWDAAHPRHKAGDGTFATFATVFGGFLNPVTVAP